VSLRTLSHWTSVELVLHSREILEDLSKKSIDLGLVEEINSVSKILFLEVLEVSLVMEFLILSFSDFLNFVVVNVKLFSIEDLLMEFSLGLLGLLRILETNEGIDSLSFLREHLNVFNFSILSEEFFKLLLGGVGWEVFNIEIASLLGVLVSKHFLGLLH
jgi:hypothetical protein